MQHKSVLASVQSNDSSREVSVANDAVDESKRNSKGQRSVRRRSVQRRETELYDVRSRDPVTFEVDSPQLEIVALMRKAKIRDELILAYVRTGFILTKENYNLLTREDRGAWDRAITEYQTHAAKGALSDRSKPSR
jgi:hypothetical protein